MQNQIISMKNKISNHFYFRTWIPNDLVTHFNGKREFQISLRDVSIKNSLLVSLTLKNLVNKLFTDIRLGMKSLELEQVKEILRIEVRKSILHAHRVREGTNRWSEDGIDESLDSINKKESNLKVNLKSDLNSYQVKVSKKLENILESLDIQVDKNSLEFTKLRNNFIDLYLLRHQWMKELVSETGRTDDDFRRQVDEKLKMELFPDLTQPLTPVIENYAPEPTQPYQVQSNSLNSLQSSPISKCLGLFMDEKGDIREKTVAEIKNSVNLLIEEFGDIPIGTITQENGTLLKSHIIKLPKNRSKLPIYRDKDFHELVEMNVKDKISDTTVNKHLTHLSSFLDWTKRHGYSNLNPFDGIKLKRKTNQRDERDKFTDKEIKTLFSKNNYIHFTEVELKKFAYYWCPLISIFSGMRLNEICALYLDNIRGVQGNHRNKRWCFDIVEEPNRPDKKLKNKSSRRILPIHETLIELGFLDFVELIKKLEPKHKRLFEHLPYGEGSYGRNVSKFWNQRYLPKLGLKTNKKNFHSLRHSVADHLKQKGVEPHFINELLGHSQGDISSDRYGSAYNPDILFNKCVSKIFYETSHTRGIDFKSLKVDWKKIIR